MLPEGTRLYNDSDTLSPEYANYYIHNAFVSRHDAIDEINAREHMV